MVCLSRALSSDLYREVSQLAVSRGVEKFIGIGPALSSCADVIEIEEKYFFADTDTFMDSPVFDTLHDEVILIKGARCFGFDSITDSLVEKVHETTLEINLNAMVENLNYYRSFMKPETKLVCMIKADGYGAGAVEIAKTLQDHRVDYLAVAVAVSGVGLLYQGDGNDKLSTAGFALVMCSSLLYALYIISVNQWKNPGMSNIKFTFYILLFGLITMFIYSFIAGEKIQMLQTPMHWLYAVQLALLPTVLSLFFMTISINLIGSTPAAIMGALEPVTAVIIGVSIFGESFSFQLAIGILAILAGVTIIIARKK